MAAKHKKELIKALKKLLHSHVNVVFDGNGVDPAPKTIKGIKKLAYSGPLFYYLREPLEAIDNATKEDK